MAVRQSLSLIKTLVINTPHIFNRDVRSARSYHRWVAPTLREIQRRKDKLGEQAPNPRSTYIDWNYDAELYAFGKRLGEEFKPEILKRALTHKSYIYAREEKLKAEGSFLQPDTKENSDLIERGTEIISNRLKDIFKTKYPEALIPFVCDYLINEETLSYTASHIGLKDIILTVEFPVEKATLSNSFKAIVAALESSVDLARAEKFVDDILVTQLNGKDLFDIWEPAAPYEYLKGLLKDKELEPRLCNQSASNTILANYQVGIYSSKKLLGIGWGETINTAKDTAALDAIQKIYQIR